MKVWRKKVWHTCVISMCAYITVSCIFTRLHAFDFEKFIETFQEKLDPDALAELVSDTVDTMHSSDATEKHKDTVSSPTASSATASTTTTPKTPYERFINPVFIEPKKDERFKQKFLDQETLKSLNIIIQEWEKNRKALQLKLDVKQDFSPIFRTHYLDKIRESGDRLFIILKMLLDEVYRDALLNPATTKKDDLEKIKKHRQDLVNCLANIKKYNQKITVLASQDLTVEKQHEDQITALARQQTAQPPRSAKKRPMASKQKKGDRRKKATRSLRLKHPQKNSPFNTKKQPISRNSHTVAVDK